MPCVTRCPVMGLPWHKTGQRMIAWPADLQESGPDPYIARRNEKPYYRRGAEAQRTHRIGHVILHEVGAKLRLGPTTVLEELLSNISREDAEKNILAGLSALGVNLLAYVRIPAAAPQPTAL
jgi:hypothetical protein